MNQTGTAGAARTESGEVSELSLSPRREVLLAVLPMVIMAAYLVVSTRMNVAAFFPAFGIAGVTIPVILTAVFLIRRRPIPTWLLPWLGIAIGTVLMSLHRVVSAPLAVPAWLLLSGLPVIALLALHRKHPLPLAVWGSLALIYFLEWRAVAFGVIRVTPPTLDPQFGKTFTPLDFASISLPPVLSILVAISAWLGRSHRQHALLAIFAPILLLIDIMLVHSPMSIDEYRLRAAISSDGLLWAGLYLLWAAAIIAMLRARTSIQSARIALLAFVLVAILLIATSLRKHYTSPVSLTYNEVDAARMFQLAAALLASALAINATGRPKSSEEALQANPVYRWVISQHGVTLSRLARVRSGLALAAILLCLLSSASLLDSMLPGRAFMSSLIWNVVILGTVFVAQMLIPTFLAVESARRLIPMVNSDMFVLVRITQQGAGQIVSGLDAGIRRKLRAALVGYGLILLVFYPDGFDLLSLFHSYGHRTLEFSIAVRVGLFGMALVAIRLGELFALVSRNASEARLGAGLLTFILTLVLIGAPLPIINGGLFYVAALLLIAFVPIVIADRLTQVNTWLIARQAREIT
jgi:hypothetical protein